MLDGILKFRSKRPSVQAIVQRSLDTHEMSRRDYLYIASAVLQCQASSAECRQMNQLFDDLRTGRLHLVD